MDILEFLIQGGPVMGVIVVASAAAVVLFFERLYVLRVEKVVPYHLVDEVQQSVEEGASHRGKSILKRDKSPMAPVLRALLQHEEESLETLTKVGEDAGRQQAILLERRVKWLGTLAAVIPLLGLMGTAWGMFGVFTDVQATGSGTLETMTPGMQQSLSTTAVGLGMGVLLFLGHRFIVSRLEQVIIEMEMRAMNVADACAIVRGRRDAVLERQNKLASQGRSRRRAG